MLKRPLVDKDSVTRADPSLHQRLRVGIFNVNAEDLGLSSGENNFDNVVKQLLIDVDLFNHFSGRQNISGCCCGLNLLGLLISHAPDDFFFFLLVGIVDSELEHKAVDLGFGQGIGPLLLNGIQCLKMHLRA